MTEIEIFRYIFTNFDKIKIFVNFDQNGDRGFAKMLSKIDIFGNFDTFVSKMWTMLRFSMIF